MGGGAGVSLTRKGGRGAGGRGCDVRGTRGLACSKSDN